MMTMEELQDRLEEGEKVDKAEKDNKNSDDNDVIELKRTQ